MPNSDILSAKPAEPHASPADLGLAEALRAVMRRLPFAVAVITSGRDDDRYAMAATSVTTLSLSPPSMLICVNRSSSIHHPLLHGQGFCVNFLTREHEALARACSGAAPRELRFAAAEFGADQDGRPVLKDALASISCAQDGRYLYGTHTIVIGRVQSVAARSEANPLIYQSGVYG